MKTNFFSKLIFKAVDFIAPMTKPPEITKLPKAVIDAENELKLAGEAVTEKLAPKADLVNIEASIKKAQEDFNSAHTYTDPDGTFSRTTLRFQKSEPMEVKTTPIKTKTSNLRTETKNSNHEVIIGEASDDYYISKNYVNQS